MVNSEQNLDTSIADAPAVATGDAVGALVKHYHRSPIGTQARLRRSHPIDDSAGALFESELALQAAGIEAQGPMRDRWALVLHCIAIARGRHMRIGSDGTGQVLAALWPSSDARMRQLIEADFETLCDLMPRIARRLDAGAVTVDWWPLAALLLYDGDRARLARRQLVAGYLRASTLANAAQGATAPGSSH